MQEKAFRELEIETVPISHLKPYSNNARVHTPKQIGQIADSIRAFGWTNPILVDRQGGVIAGHGRLEAAKLLGFERVPVISIADMSEPQKRAYILADNRLAERAGWDREVLAIELQGLLSMDLSFEITTIGFEMGEIDLVIGESKAKKSTADDEISDADLAGQPVTVRGDLWLLGPHKLLCGDALDSTAFVALMAGEKAELVFSDPPYNVPIAGHVSGLGRRKHGEFAMACGEMSPADFSQFLKTVFTHMAQHSVAGSIHFICMDWRHLAETLAAGAEAYSELENICVWAKTNGGMGSFYRSAHEFVLVFKSGKAAHLNNVSLGVHGRNRTNVWTYAGVNSFGAGRNEALDMHPTVKPLALVADAILDASRRNGLVLDPFVGSGTTILACHHVGRIARVMELNPRYVDVCLRRYNRLVGVEPIHAASGRTFRAVEASRSDVLAGHERLEGALA